MAEKIKAHVVKQVAKELSCHIINYLRIEQSRQNEKD